MAESGATATDEGDGANIADDDLMLLCREGSERAFAMLIRRHERLVFGYATRFLGDSVAARDVAQEVFLTLWAERHRYESKQRFKSYLMTLTFHRAHQAAQRRTSQAAKAARIRQVEPEPTPPETGLDALLAISRKALVRRALAELPEATRQVLVLRFMDGQSLEDIARMTGRPLGTVKSNLFRGLKRLRAQLGTGTGTGTGA